MILVHKTKLYPTKSQEVHFKKASGCSRFAYNWGLNRAKEMLDSGSHLDISKIRNEFNNIKKEKFPFVLEVSKLITQIPIESHLKRAFSAYFKKISSYPKFKKKGVRDSFHYDFPKIKPGKSIGNRLSVPRLGSVRMAEKLRFDGRICYFTISRACDAWYVSIAVEIKNSTIISENQGAIGVDLGIKSAITLSNGIKYDAPKPLKKEIAKLSRASRGLSRKQFGSNNHRKQNVIVGKIYRRMSNIRNNFWHKTTTDIASKYKIICIEDLNIHGMCQNKNLSRSIHDVSIGMFYPLLKYKTERRGGTILMSDRWFPSTKTCSSCGYINKEIKLSDRHWKCPSCGESHDRDINAAKNLVRQNLSELTPIEITSTIRCA